MAKRSGPAKPGDQIPFRLKKNESQDVLDWVNSQDTIADSIRYLIQMDVARNGGKAINYQSLIAPTRNEEYIQRRLAREKEAIIREAKGEQATEEFTSGRFVQSNMNPSYQVPDSSLQKNIPSEEAIPSQTYGESQYVDSAKDDLNYPPSTVETSVSSNTMIANERNENLALSPDEIPDIPEQHPRAEGGSDVEETEEIQEITKTPEQIAEEKKRARQKRMEERQRKLEAELAEEMKESEKEASNKKNSTNRKVTNSKGMSQEELDRLEREALEGALDW